jgi:hypothetical protein
MITKLTDNLLTDFRADALDIILNGNTSKSKNLGMSCNTCDYKYLCQAEINGDDVEFVKMQSYKNIRKTESAA